MSFNHIPTSIELAPQEILSRQAGEKRRGEVLAPLKVGVIGYSGQPCDLKLVRQYLEEAISTLGGMPIKIISGFTAVGVPLVAYQWAADNEAPTVGIACEQALSGEFVTWDVDERYIVGKEWGDPLESEFFLQSIDVLIRIGGGRQAMRECAMAHERGIPVLEFDLDVLPGVA